MPDTGAMLDQDAALIHRMVVLDNVHGAVTRYRNAVGAQIHQLTERERMILKWLIDEGIL